MKSEDVDRFWSKVDKTSGCWLWVATLDHRGYGKFPVRVDGKKKFLTASRASWTICNGDIPNGMHVLHRCDRPACVNPNHLFLGSRQDNMDDMVKKSRSSYKVGVVNPRAKLNPEKVAQIRVRRSNGESAKDLALEFGVSPKTVYNLVDLRKWSGIRQPTSRLMKGV